jgi:hypothetical protein
VPDYFSLPKVIGFGINRNSIPIVGLGRLSASVGVTHFHFYFYLQLKKYNRKGPQVFTMAYSGPPSMGGSDASNRSNHQGNGMAPAMAMPVPMQLNGPQQHSSNVSHSYAPMSHPHTSSPGVQHMPQEVIIPFSKRPPGSPHINSSPPNEVIVPFAKPSHEIEMTPPVHVANQYLYEDPYQTAASVPERRTSIQMNGSHVSVVHTSSSYQYATSANVGNNFPPSSSQGVSGPLGPSHNEPANSFGGMGSTALPTPPPRRPSTQQNPATYYNNPVHTTPGSQPIAPPGSYSASHEHSNIAPAAPMLTGANTQNVPYPAKSHGGEMLPVESPFANWHMRFALLSLVLSIPTAALAVAANSKFNAQESSVGGLFVGTLGRVPRGAWLMLCVGSFISSSILLVVVGRLGMAWHQRDAVPLPFVRALSISSVVCSTLLLIACAMLWSDSTFDVYGNPGMRAVACAARSGKLSSATPDALAALVSVCSELEAAAVFAAIAGVVWIGSGYTALRSWHNLKHS